jgi:hypothetical protein
MSAPVEPAVEPADDNREWLLDLLPKSAHKHIDAILEYFALQPASVVEVIGARVGVEEVDAYGLHITLDANGNAERVVFPYGAEVTEWWS